MGPLPMTTTIWALVDELKQNPTERTLRNALLDALQEADWGTHQQCKRKVGKIVHAANVFKRFEKVCQEIVADGPRAMWLRREVRRAAGVEMDAGWTIEVFEGSHRPEVIERLVVLPPAADGRNNGLTDRGLEVFGAALGLTMGSIAVGSEWCWKRLRLWPSMETESYP